MALWILVLLCSVIVLLILAPSRTSDLCPAEWAEWPVELAPWLQLRLRVWGGEGGEARQVQWGVRSWEHGTSHNLTLRLRLLGGLDTVDTGLSGHTTSSRSRSRSSLWITGVSRSWTEVLPPQVTRDVNCLVNEKTLEFYQIVLISPSLSKLISSENVWSLPYFWRPFWKKNNFIMLLQD